MTRRSLRALIVSLVSVAGIGLSSLAPAATAAQPEFASYIVTVAKGSEQSVQARAKALGGEIGYVYTTALNGFSLSLPTPAADALAKAPGVQSVERDGVASAFETAQSWGLDRVDQNSLPLDSSYSFSSTGSNAKVYVIDTGINSGISDFGGRVLSGMDFVSSTSGVTAPTTDCGDHGTHVAGTVGSGKYGIAKAVYLIPVRVLDCCGSGSWSTVIKGIDLVAGQVASGKTVIANMSLGGGYLSSVNSAVTNAIGKGVFFAIAAGNSGQDACRYSPASVQSPGSITVAATDRTDSRPRFSNYGTCIDIFAPGVGITSYRGSDGAEVSWDGTSMATPHVAGVAARLLGANTSLSPTQLASAITSGSTANKVSNAGKGSVNRLLFIDTSK